MQYCFGRCDGLLITIIRGIFIFYFTLPEHSNFTLVAHYASYSKMRNSNRFLFVVYDSENDFVGMAFS